MPKKKKIKATNATFQERMIGWIKKIFTLQSFAFAFGAVSCIATVWMLVISINSQSEQTFPPKLLKIDSLKNSIEKKIAIIEKSFNPARIPQKLDEEYEKGIIIVKDFQINSLKFARYWKEKKNSPSLEQLIDDDSIVAEAQSWQSNLISEYNLLSYTIMDDMEVLDLYGNEHGILDYFLNKSKWNKLKLLEKRKDEFDDSLTTLCSKYWNIVNTKESNKRINKTPYDKEYYDNLKRAIEIENIFRENEVFYEFDNYLFDLIISQNKMYEITVNDFLMQKANR